MNEDTKYNYLAENIALMSKEFTDYLVNTAEGLKNLGKDIDSIWEKSYPIISSFFLYKSLEYLHTRFLNEDAQYTKLEKFVKTIFKEQTKIDPGTVLSEYESLSSNNSYMREMYIGDKIVKSCGGTFSNRVLIDEVCVKFYFYFNNIAVPKLTRLWMLYGRAGNN